MLTIDQSVLTFNKDNQPFASAEPGEIMLFKTLDCFSDQIQSEDQMVESIDIDQCNPAAGPVYIKGAEPGDVLVVDILDIQVNDQGATCIFPGIGPLWERSELRTRVLPIKNGVTTFNDVTWHVDPMIGVIGVAPADEPVPCGHPFQCGGNMDSNKITKGSRVYLPVQVEGALLQMGDLHASMGDGEIVGTGLEIAGEITVRTSIIKSFELNWPVTETKDFWYVNTFAPTCDEGIKLGLIEMQRLISSAYNWDLTDAAIYLSLQGEVGVNQSCLCAEIGNVMRVGAPKISGKDPLIK